MTITRDFWAGVAVSLATVVVGYAVARPDYTSEAYRQRLNLAAAQKELPRVEAIVQG